MVKNELIFKVFDVILKSRLWKEQSKEDTLKALIYMNDKGWLYNFNNVIVGAYRIPSITINHMDILPRQEMGNILYVPVVVKIDKNVNVFNSIRQLTREYLDKNNDITEIVLQDKNDKIRRYKIGESNGKFKEIRTATNAHAVH